MAKNKIGKYLLTLLLILSFLITLAVYLVNKPITYEGTHSRTKGNTATVLLIDGLDQARFTRLLDSGRLPNLEKLIQESIYIPNGIGAFPSMTGYAFYPFITGHDAVESGIIGLRWFDRNRNTGNLRNYVGRTNVWMNQDITDSIATFFELCGDQYNSSINSYMNRGVADARMTGWAHTTAKFEGRSIFGAIRSIPFAGKELAKNHYQHESAVMRMAELQLKDNPKFQWVTLPSPDATFHVDGMSEYYNNLLIHIDSLIGDFRVHIAENNQSDTRMLAVVTDHGVAEVNQNIDFIREVKSIANLNLIRGNSINYKSMMLDEKIDAFVEKDGYFVINGNLCAMIYLSDAGLEGQQKWKHNLTSNQITNYRGVDIPEKLSKMTGIEFVIYKQNDSTIVIRNHAGYALITQKDQKYGYRIGTSDPLNYGKYKLTDTLLSKDEWLRLSIHTDFPDAVFRIYSLMRLDHVGDLLLTSKEGYDFARDYESIVGNYKGGHGGIKANQLRVPFIIHQPTRGSEIKQHMRAEDVGKIIGDWLGFSKNY